MVVVDLERVRDLVVRISPRTQHWSWCRSKCFMHEKRLLTLRRTATNFVHSGARWRVSIFFEFLQQLACESADCGLSAHFFLCFVRILVEFFWL